ncbi:hypothetical protein [Methanosarcina sp.]|uniref:hypothetical protein n=1 Tax=Methanosarcina sp. TaxID=2213 RepID=UPI003C725D7A
MQLDISTLISNSWFSFFLALISILSFIGMFYFYYKSKKEKLPLFCMKSTKILEDLSERYEPLQITYKEKKIKNLTVTQVGFWNCGKETIKKSDIATKDPLSIKTKNNAQILDVKITTSENNPNGFEYNLSTDLSCLIYNFDYIDKNQGALIQLLHTGTSSSDLELKGSIIGFGEPRYFYKDPIYPDNTVLNRILIKFTTKKQRQFLYHFFELRYPMFIFALGLFLSLLAVLFPPTADVVNGWIIIVILAIVFLFLGIILLKDWFRVQTTQMPVDLDIYMEEAVGK